MLSIFPETNKIKIEKAMHMKLNNFNKKKNWTSYHKYNNCKIIKLVVDLYCIHIV